MYNLFVIIDLQPLLIALDPTTPLVFSLSPPPGPGWRNMVRWYYNQPNFCHLFPPLGQMILFFVNGSDLVGWGGVVGCTLLYLVNPIPYYCCQLIFLWKLSLFSVETWCIAIVIVWLLQLLNPSIASLSYLSTPINACSYFSSGSCYELFSKYFSNLFSDSLSGIYS